MIGLDTNVLVRYIMQDDAKQSLKASKLIESLNSENPGFITLVSIVEIYWVLTSCYKLSAEQVAQALEAMLHSKQLIIQNADHVLRALRVFKADKVDFADCVIESSAAGAGCAHTMTFDKGAAKYAGMTLIR